MIDFESVYKCVSEEMQKVHAAILETAKMAETSCVKTLEYGLGGHLQNLTVHYHGLSRVLATLLESALAVVIGPDTEEGPSPEKLLEDAIAAADPGKWAELGRVMSAGIRDRIEQQCEGKISDLGKSWNGSAGPEVGG